MSDADEAVAEADAAAKAVERLEEEGVDAAGDTGESEPALTIEDVLATFPADRIVVFTHPDLDCREKAYAEGAQGALRRARHPRDVQPVSLIATVLVCV